MSRLSRTAQTTLGKIEGLITRREKGQISWRKRDKKIRPLVDQIAESGIDPALLAGQTRGWIIREVRWAKGGRGRNKR